MTHYRRYGTILCLVCLLQALASQISSAQITRTQTIHLNHGWNAVFLEVDPTNASPANCFQGTPVTIAAVFTGADKTVQFVQNPSTNNLTPQNGWDVWYAPKRADAFLTSVFLLNGNKAYLLYADSDFTWRVTGAALLTSVTWKAKSFTLTGFGVDEVSPPTFEQFFDGSANHRPYRIYRLVNDVWVKVDNTQTTQIRSGEAYWIYCQGSSDYQGPLNLKSSVGNKMLLHGANSSGLAIKNNSRNPLNVKVENVSGPARLPLAYVLRAVTATNVTATTFDLPDVYNLPAFDAGEKRGFWLTLRPEQMTDATQTGLLKITTDLGTQSWLPIEGSRFDSQTPN